MNYYLEDGESMVSIGLRGLMSSASVSVALLESMYLKHSQTKFKAISDIERMIGSEDSERHLKATTIFACLSAGWKPSTSVSFSFTGGQVQKLEPKRPESYQTPGPLKTEDGKFVGRVVAPCLTTESSKVPMRSYNNDVCCIQGRLEHVRNFTIPESVYSRYAIEFAQFVVPEQQRGTGSPLTVSDVVDRQKKPAQKQRALQAQSWLSHMSSIVVKAFQKAEAYPSVNDPRNISQTPTNHMLNLSTFTYAFKDDILKGQPWYMPAKTPTQIAGRVAELCHQYAAIAETDYSRFDGTISVWLRRNVEQPCYLRWVANNYYGTLRNLLQAEINPRGITQNGVVYNIQGSRLSGSPLTTDGNTLVNAFVSYAAARNAGMNPSMSWHALGAYAGDDGLTPIDATIMSKTASDLGLRVECESRHRGETLSFLSRVFGPAIWDGETGSVQAAVRTLSKLHISFAPPEISDNDALANRAAGYLSLDPEAPITSNWCHKVLDLTLRNGVVKKTYITDLPYILLNAIPESEMPDEIDWSIYEKLANNSWPQLRLDDAIRVVAEQLKTTAAEVMRIMNTIDRAKSLDELSALVAVTIPTKIVAAVDGDMRRPDKPASVHTDAAVRRAMRPQPNHSARRARHWNGRPGSAN